MAGGDQPLQRMPVQRVATALVRHLAIPFEAESVQSPQDMIRGAGHFPRVAQVSIRSSHSPRARASR